MKNFVSEMLEIAKAKANPLQNLSLVIATLSETVGPREADRIKNLSRPVTALFLVHGIVDVTLRQY